MDAVKALFHAGGPELILPQGALHASGKRAKVRVEHARRVVVERHPVRREILMPACDAVQHERPRAVPLENVPQLFEPCVLIPQIGLVAELLPDLPLHGPVLLRWLMFPFDYITDPGALQERAEKKGADRPDSPARLTFPPRWGMI